VRGARYKVDINAQGPIYRGSDEIALKPSTCTVSCSKSRQPAATRRWYSPLSYRSEGSTTKKLCFGSVLGPDCRPADSGDRFRRSADAGRTNARPNEVGSVDRSEIGDNRSNDPVRICWRMSKCSAGPCKVAACVCAKARRYGTRIVYERWHIVPLCPSLLDAAGMSDRHADGVVRNVAGTFRPPRPKDMPSERPGFGIAFPQLVSLAQPPGLHGDPCIDRIGILADGRRGLNVPSGSVSSLPTFACHGFAIVFVAGSALMVELCPACSIFRRRRARAVRARRQGRASAVMCGLLGKAGLHRPDADQRDRQKMDNDPQAALLGIVGSTRPPALRRARPGTSPEPVAPEIVFAVPERPRAT
jgi:hypothetical protein